MAARAKVAKSVEFPAEVAAELEAVARASDRSLAAQVRVAVMEHLANRVVEAAGSASGFSRGGLVSVSTSPDGGKAA